MGTFLWGWGGGTTVCLEELSFYTVAVCLKAYVSHVAKQLLPASSGPSVK